MGARNMMQPVLKSFSALGHANSGVQEFVQERRPFCFPITHATNSRIRAIYMGNAVQLMCNEKETNHENLNFKSVASAHFATSALRSVESKHLMPVAKTNFAMSGALTRLKRKS